MTRPQHVSGNQHGGRRSHSRLIDTVVTPGFQEAAWRARCGRFSRRVCRHRRLAGDRLAGCAVHLAGDVVGSLLVELVPGFPPAIPRGRVGQLQHRIDDEILGDDGVLCWLDGGSATW